MIEPKPEDPVEIPIACPPNTSPGAGSNVADGSSAASNVWGLSLSMFAVAGLSTAMLSVS